jgi:phage protein D/phage baseplate assembly protein gpV
MTPALSISIAGSAVAGDSARALLSVVLRERLSAPALCELEFADLAEARLGRTVRTGDRLEVALREPSIAVFEGEVTALEYGYGADNYRRLWVRGYDVLHRLRKRQSLTAHADLGLADLARKLTADLGVSVDGGEGLPLLSRRIQQGESDLDLLIDVANRYGYTFSLRGSVLHLIHGKGIGFPIAARLGEELREATVEINAHATCRRVEVSAWDPFRGQRRSGTADGKSKTLETDAEALPTSVGGSDIRFVAGALAESDLEAEAVAEGELERRTVTEVVLRGTTVDLPDLHAGSILQAQGIAEDLCGRYVVAAVTHRISAIDGYRSEFTTQLDPSPARSRPPATLGIVTDSADPEHAGRVRVSLPAYGDAETDWISVVSVAAGRGKGLVAIPEPGDRVLVLPLGDEPARSVVLGGLYCPDAPPDSGFTDSGSRRYTLVTPEGQRLCLDDGTRTLRLETQDGHKIDMSPEGFAIHSSRDLLIEAPDRRIRIRAKAIDFERA